MTFLLRNILLPVLCSLLLATMVAAQETPSLRFDGQGLFKIVQFTDTHYIAGNETAKASVDLVAETLDAEKPQLVVFTGDIVVGGDIMKGWDEILSPVMERKTPWAVVFGNHDDEGGKTRQQIMDHITQKPFCCVSAGPKDVKGIGNYVLEVKDADGAARWILYCMDSNAYSTVEGVGGYGWFDFDQIRWYRDTSASYTQKNNGKPLPALAFFHIPLNEYSIISAKPENLIGVKNEDECPGAVNSGMFAAMLECGDVMGTFVGHDHVNDYIGVHHGIALAYGRFSGTKTTYAFEPHGARVIETASRTRAFKTWIRLKGGETIQPAEYPKSFQ